jgi:hypothetical protein
MRELAQEYGQVSFLVAPLSFAQLDMGALILMSSTPANIDKYACKLAVELSLVLSQTLYTLLCMEQLRAGEQIINDVLPEKVNTWNLRMLRDSLCFQVTFLRAGCMPIMS